MSAKDADYEAFSAIQKIKQEQGASLVILAHHYQRMEIVGLGDFAGDSFELSRRAAARRDARFIVFCGVHFMAESAAILAGENQTVQIPDINAGCPMADMADVVSVSRAWDELGGVMDTRRLVPLVYVNSDAMLKAFTGRNGGSACTSANAEKAIAWAFEKGEKVLFFPDQHLGRNSGNALGLASQDMVLWKSNEPLGGNTKKALERARLILWDGHCHVHTDFTPGHISQARKKFPDAKIIVHPECPEEVVKLADASGSTSRIIRFVEDAPQGSTIIVGTEFNLVQRLNIQTPDKMVIPLARSACPNMAKITLGKLLHTLQNLGTFNVVRIDPATKKDAALALDRMLALAG
jgi:quinolinate synthase